MKTIVYAALLALALSGCSTTNNSPQRAMGNVEVEQASAARWEARFQGFQAPGPHGQATGDTWAIRDRMLVDILPRVEAAGFSVYQIIMFEAWTDPYRAAPAAVQRASPHATGRMTVVGLRSTDDAIECSRLDRTDCRALDVERTLDRFRGL